MEFREYCLVLLRRLPTVLLIIVGVAVATAGTAKFLVPIRYETTLFFTVTTEFPEQIPEGGLIDATRAADAFTEVIQGWLKSAPITKKIYEKAGFSFQFSMRKIERQNISLTIKTGTADEGKTAASVIEQVVRTKIADYNQASKSRFTMAFTNTLTEQKIPRWKMYALFGLIAGFIASILYVFSEEYLRGVVSVASQVESIVSMPIVKVLKRGEEIPKTFQHHAVIEMRHFSIEKIPVDAKSIVAVCRIGHTKIGDLLALRTVFKHEILPWLSP